MDDWQYTFPKLEGTATVEMVVDGETISIEVNGEDAPVTASNFVDLVERGFYDELMFHRVEEGFVAQAGDPESLETDDPEGLGAGGFIDPETDEERNIPLEIKPEGATEPIYSQTFDDAEIAEEPELPHTEGAVAMARTSDPDTASSQFYFALQDLPQLDGSYSVFGYVDEGIELLEDIEVGDRITSAKVVEGTAPGRDSELISDSDLLNYFVNNDNKFTVEAIANSVEDSEEATDAAAEEAELEPEEEAADDSEETTEPVTEETESEPEEEAADDSEETTEPVTEETELEPEEEEADSEVDGEDDAVASGETGDEVDGEDGLVASQITDSVEEDDAGSAEEDDTDGVEEDDADSAEEDDTDGVEEDDADSAEEEEVADETDNTIEMSSVELEFNAIAGLKGDDEIRGTDDGDIINGNEGDDAINGLDGDDWLRGGKGDDILTGGRGDDFLVGDYGSDTLTGGLGADTFILRVDTAEGVQDVAFADWILDFNNLEEGDRIAIVSDDFTLEDLNFDLDGENTLITLAEGGDILGVVQNTPSNIFESPESVISVIPEDDLAMQLG